MFIKFVVILHPVSKWLTKRGAAAFADAEIIPLEPGPGNAGGGTSGYTPKIYIAVVSPF